MHIKVQYCLLSLLGPNKFEVPKKIDKYKLPALTDIASPLGLLMESSTRILGSLMTTL